MSNTFIRIIFAYAQGPGALTRSPGRAHAANNIVVIIKEPARARRVRDYL